MKIETNNFGPRLIVKYFTSSRSYKAIDIKIPVDDKLHADRKGKIIC
jgi:hypothetical protein